MSTRKSTEALLAISRLDEFDGPTAEVWLSASEQARLQTLQRPRRRQAFLAGRWLARRVLGALLDQAPQHVDLLWASSGRSTGAQGLQISISHSADWVAVAAGPIQSLGLDVEQSRAGRDWAGMAALIGWTDCPDEAHFLRHWTLGEAWLKAQAEPWSLADLAPLRWVPDAGGPARHLRVGELHLAIHGAATWGWLERPPSLHDGGRWAPRSAPQPAVQSTPKSK